MIVVGVVLGIVVGTVAFVYGVRELLRLRGDREALAFPWERVIRRRQLDDFVRETEVHP